jgi:ethanolamine utilization protein EutN
MYLARIVGRVVATVKQDTLEAQPMQWIQPVDADGSDRGSPIVAVDSVGLGPGELCYYITAREASFTLEDSFAAVDAGIVGKVDSITLAERERGSGKGEGA